MFGKNIIRKKYINPNKLQVHNIFYTIQGEGPFAGRPAIFIRLTGCNQRCYFCDTVWDDDNDPVYEVLELCRKAIKLWPLKHKQPLVVITGGEPLIQDLSMLVQALVIIYNFNVQIETAGTIHQQWLYNDFAKKVHVVISPKTPKIQVLYADKNNLNKANLYWKYVISHRAQFNEFGIPIWNTQVNSSSSKPLPLAMPINIKTARVYLSPCDEYDEESNKKNKALVAKLCMDYGYKANIQLHKEFGLE